MNIVIIGDCILDIYYESSSNRLAPEALIPVFRNEFIYYKLGGASNIALNLKSLGYNPILITICGDDENYNKFINLINNYNIENYIIKDNTRKTTSKNRIICNNISEKTSRVMEIHFGESISVYLNNDYYDKSSFAAPIKQFIRSPTGLIMRSDCSSRRDRSRSPVRRSSVRRSPVRSITQIRNDRSRSSVRRSPVRRSPVRRSPVRRSPVRRSPVRRSPVRRSPVRRSSIRK
jgi:hypothetical protein